MKKLFKKVKKVLLFLLIIPLLYFAYKGFYPKKQEPSYSVIEKITTGKVKTGINASGTIIAAQKLDLNIYKKALRIDEVNAVNGKNFKKGDLLFSFDNGDILNELRSAELSVAQARLALANQNISNAGVNSELESLKDQLLILEGEINRQEQISGRAQRSYLSDNLDIEPHPDDYERLIVKNEPQVSGIYHGDLGEYSIEIYSSSSDSGYSYRTKGLEYSRGSIYFSKKIALGTRGLFINFSSDIKSGDEWVLSIPNKNLLENSEAADSYEDKKRSLEDQYRKNLIQKKQLEKQISIEENNDKGSIKVLRKNEKKLSLARAYQSLKDAQKVVNERKIIAPFDGTITGMRNVIKGTKPRNDSDDPVVLGKLVSHDYFVTFSLSLSDVTKVTEGKKVEIKIPALPALNNLYAKVTEIDILPKNEGLAQYEVRALVDLDTLDDGVILREGLSADINVIEKEKDEVVRVPKVALSYEGDQVSVLKILNNESGLSDEVINQGGVDLSQYKLETEKVNIELGVEGKNYIEVISGLDTGDLIVSTVSTKKIASLFGSDDSDEDDEF